MELTNEHAELKKLADRLAPLKKVNKAVLHQAVQAQVMWRRQKSGSTKTRSEVHGTTKKSVKQKGTGGARHGARTAPIFVGGGICHGPKPILARHKMNERTFKNALWMALKDRLEDKKVFVLSLDENCKGKTKEVASLLGKKKIESAIVCVPAEGLFYRACRNIEKVKAVGDSGLNPFDILRFQNVVLSKTSLTHLLDRLEKNPLKARRTA